MAAFGIKVRYADINLIKPVSKKSRSKAIKPHRR